MKRDIWIYFRQREGEIEELSLSLINEAVRLRQSLSEEATITGLIIGSQEVGDGLKRLRSLGVERCCHILTPPEIEKNSVVLAELVGRAIEEYQPFCLISESMPETDDLLARLAASTASPMATRVVDYRLSENETLSVVRPVDNGFLFQESVFEAKPPYYISLLPSILSDPQVVNDVEMEIITISGEPGVEGQKVELVEIIEADPSELALEEADIIVAGGRGAGKAEQFDVIHDLAKVLGGSVGGTRPIIDWHTLEFERQIGQTGKTVTPRLILNCGISGANEYTAGMEKSQNVVVIDQNPKARMFKFADIGAVGDVHEILPRLTQKIAEIKSGET